MAPHTPSVLHGVGALVRLDGAMDSWEQGMRVHSVVRVVLLHGGARHVGVDGLGMHGQVGEQRQGMHVQGGLHKLRVDGRGGDNRLVGAEPKPRKR